LEYPFAPPVQALAKIESPRHWKKYKQLFRMHMHHLITENYLRLGERYEKNHIFFFNQQFKKEILEGLQITKIYYQRAQHYWDKVKSQADALWEDRDTELTAIDGEVEKWQDLVYKIHFNHIEVNYPKQIKKRLQEVEKKLSMVQKGEYEQ
jgi:hypothetical protein